ncbi:flagellar hook-basal body complex protein FliE [Desulfovibrio subterraneus]|jgi:flagellar hook-basal body complex protein FliE|uniref:Flagellar hook-basal body complex protein FliE n=1 Tax=Desulfovibrio subterraneus TaxID=2718620 RepID=A0A7J0BNQ4_9BACT|nr:flagellar hook-basal body complex protein FliE [Desulfovibrio subterraneus]WBF66322.1 flagellar hook-basal body complex protein FliE [Desulfovibrio subterraneus]GFM34832.1 flagellar hook-basal body complex protein FliE [Desulfovibrio subterraneus]
MSIQNIGMKAYSNAMHNFSKAQQATTGQSFTLPEAPKASLVETVKDSVRKTNDMQGEKERQIKSFASGETQNVHELMVTLQKASLAMSMTSAVRNKVMEAYKELSRTGF